MSGLQEEGLEGTVPTEQVNEDFLRNEIEKLPKEQDQKSLCNFIVTKAFHNTFKFRGSNYCQTNAPTVATQVDMLPEARLNRITTALSFPILSGDYRIKPRSFQCLRKILCIVA